MPSPAELDDGVILDVGELIPDEPDIPAPHGAPPGPSQPAGPAVPPEDTAGSLPPEGDDEPPAHARRDWHRSGTRAPKPKPGRITAAVRSDIEAKIGFGLTVPGAMWAARDPICGGAFMAQLPEVARVGASWVCRSSALVEWFTSPAGSGFILFLDTAAALGPVFSAVMAHHVYHSVEVGEAPADALQPDYGQYAA